MSKRQWVIFFVLSGLILYCSISTSQIWNTPDETVVTRTMKGAQGCGVNVLKYGNNAALDDSCLIDLGALMYRHQLMLYQAGAQDTVCVVFRVGGAVKTVERIPYCGLAPNYFQWYYPADQVAINRSTLASTSYYWRSSRPKQ